MEIRTILVNLDIDYHTPALLQAAMGLAQRFGAKLSAVAAAAAPADLIAVEGTAVTVGLYEAERAAIETRLRALEVDFTSTVPATLRGGCVTLLDYPTRALVEAARSADLIVTGSHLGGEEVREHNVDVGALLLSAGRPVLLVGAGVPSIAAETVIVGWKDSRESRRAVTDALPFLKAARDVVVVAIGEGEASVERGNVDDVVAWLRLHEVKARGDVYPATGTAAASLENIARRLKSDLIVTGAYGHSRLREWFFGGVTRDLIASPTFSRLMSN